MDENALFESYKKAAEAGDTSACDTMYQRGLEYYQRGEYEKAMEWLAVAAENGNGYAWLYIGMMFRDGLGVKANGGYANKALQNARNALGNQDLNFPDS